MSRRWTASILLAGTVLAGAAASAPPAKAAITANVDISFGARVPIHDDNRIFVSINSRYYNREPYFVDLWSARFRNPDDLQVFLFMVRHSSATPQHIYDLRRRGMSWFRIAQRIHMPMDVFFVRFAGPAFPPYDRVYVRYDKYHRNPRFNLALTDTDMRNLVVLRVMTDYYGFAPERAMRLRATGRDSRYLMVQEYRRRHEHEHRADYRDRDHRDSDRDHDRGRGNDYDRDHDNDYDRDRDDRDR